MSKQLAETFYEYFRLAVRDTPAVCILAKRFFWTVIPAVKDDHGQSSYHKDAGRLSWIQKISTTIYYHIARR